MQTFVHLLPCISSWTDLSFGSGAVRHEMFIDPIAILNPSSGEGNIMTLLLELRNPLAIATINITLLPELNRRRIGLLELQ